MAMEMTFSGWLNDIKKFDWAYVLKCAHHVRKKNDAGEWETVSKDYIDVIVDDLSAFPHITEDIVPCRIKVSGNFKPASYSRTTDTGETETMLYSKVWAKEIAILENSFGSSAAMDDVPF
jgi:hypothetical protein